jgi:hypothetical protein
LQKITEIGSELKAVDPAKPKEEIFTTIKTLILLDLYKRRKDAIKSFECFFNLKVDPNPDPLKRVI